MNHYKSLWEVKQSMATTAHIGAQQNKWKKNLWLAMLGSLEFALLGVGYLQHIAAAYQATPKMPDVPTPIEQEKSKFEQQVRMQLLRQNNIQVGHIPPSTPYPESQPEDRSHSMVESLLAIWTEHEDNLFFSLQDLLTHPVINQDILLFEILEELQQREAIMEMVANQQSLQFPLPAAVTDRMRMFDIVRFFLQQGTTQHQQMIEPALWNILQEKVSPSMQPSQRGIFFGEQADALELLAIRSPNHLMNFACQQDDHWRSRFQTFILRGLIQGGIDDQTALDWLASINNNGRCH